MDTQGMEALGGGAAGQVQDMTDLTVGGTPNEPDQDISTERDKDNSAEMAPDIVLRTQENEDNDEIQILEEDLSPEKNVRTETVAEIEEMDVKSEGNTSATTTLTEPETPTVDQQLQQGTSGSTKVAEEKSTDNLTSPLEAPGSSPQVETTSPGTSKSAGSSFVVPIRIPSLAYQTLPPPKFVEKEIRPTPTLASSSAGENLFKLIPLCKSINSALAPKKLPGEKRKHMGGCCNANCSQTSNDLVVAPKHAIIYFHFNTSVKKIFKICSNCLADADKYITKAVRAAQNGDCVLTFKTEPQGMDGDIIEVSAGDEEDDPVIVAEMEARENEIIELSDDFDTVLNGILARIDTKKQMEKCDKAAQLELQYLERDFVSLQSKLSFAEKQMAEAKKIYDKLTGHCQPVPVILEEIDIDAKGIIRRSRGNNPHIAKMTDNVHDEKKLKDMIQFKSESQLKVENQPMKENKRRKEEGEGEVMEVEPVQKQQETRITLAQTPKFIPRVTPSVGSVVFALNRTLLHFWLRGEIIEIVNMGPSKPVEFIVKFDAAKRGFNQHLNKRDAATMQPTKQATSKQIAYNIACPFVLPVGSRIIAKFRDELKTEPAGDGQYYAGVVAEPPKNTNNFRYLVFFDDGYAQYVNHQHVLMVYEASKEVWSDVHPDSSEFIKNYVQKYPERPMVRLTVGQVITTEWNGKWWIARVVELDCSLVKMKFENDGRFEWIYRGSTRLSPLFEKQSRQKTRQVARRQTAARSRNQPTIEYNYGEVEEELKKMAKPVAKKSTSMPQNMPDSNSYVKRIPRYDFGEFEGSIIKKAVPSTAPKTKNFEAHKCNTSCVIPYNELDRDLQKLNPLALPLYLGWTRETAKTPRRNVFYRGPCGKRLRDMDELYAYLLKTGSSIPIDHFCFEIAVDCLNEFRHARQHSFLPDLTYGKEVVPVQVVNAFDFDYPPYVEYSSSRIAGLGVTLNTEDEFLVGCDCTDDCSDKSKCSCWQLTLSGISFTKLNNDEYPMKGYENRRLNDHVVSGVYECNPRCKCRKTCMNRVVQHGLKIPLQVFKTAAKGWGIRPLFDVPEGSFICIYAGQVLTEQGANEDGKQFGDEYLAELDYIECNENIKAEYESDVTDIEDEEPAGKSGKKKPKGRNEEYSDEEVDSHANDSSYRGPAPTTSRTINTRTKNGRVNSAKSSESDEDDDGGTRKRSRFNPEVGACSKSKQDERLPLRELFGKEEQCYIMDAKTVGNIGRYLNHSCQPNVFVQNVFVDTHDVRFPWVAFFSSKHIRAGSELTWDYNYDIGSVPDKVMYCYCGSPDCRGRLL